MKYKEQAKGFANIWLAMNPGWGLGPINISSSRGSTIENSDSPVKIDQNFVDMMWGAQKKCGFTNKLAAHGFWTDCGMDVEKRREAAKRWNKKRKMQQQKRIMVAFEKQTKKIRDIQDALARRQNKMANSALHKYCAYKIQTRWRMLCATRLLWRYKTVRFLRDWCRFRLYMLCRYRCSRKINVCISNFLNRRRKQKWMQIFRASVVIKRALITVMYMKRYRIRLVRRKAVESAVYHMILFGSSKAHRKIRSQSVPSLLSSPLLSSSPPLLGT